MEGDKSKRPVRRHDDRLVEIADSRLRVCKLTKNKGNKESKVMEKNNASK